MTTYTGPIPPAPTATSSDAVWQSWWAYQNILRDLRYEDERIAAAAAAVARQRVLDAQHAEKMAAEAACAASNQALAVSQAAVAAAQQAQAAALAESGKFTEFIFPKKTRADLVFEMLQAFPQVTNMTELTAVQACERTVDAFLARHPLA